MLDRAAKSRRHALAAEATSRAAADGAASLLEDAGSIEAGASALAGGGGDPSRTVDPRALSPASADMREDAKRKRPESKAMAGNTKEAARLAASARRLAASAALTAVDAAALAEAESDAGDAPGGRIDPGAQGATAAAIAERTRAMAAASRTDAKHLLADRRTA